jgi:hypothetical protein
MKTLVKKKKVSRIRRIRTLQNKLDALLENPELDRKSASYLRLVSKWVVSRFIWIKRVDKKHGEFFDRLTHELSTEYQMDRDWAKYFSLKGLRASQAFHQAGGPTMVRLTYRPALFTDKKSWNAASLKYEEPTEDGAMESAVNVYRPSTVLWDAIKEGPQPDDEEHVATWRNLGLQLFGIDRELVEERLAFDVKHPDVKPNWHLVWISPQEGVGKDAYVWPIRVIVGAGNVIEIGGHVLKGRWTGDVVDRKKLILVSDPEDMDLRDWDRWKMHHASPPTHPTSEGKSKPYQSRYNIASFLYQTNKEKTFPKKVWDSRRLCPTDVSKPTYLPTHDDTAREPFAVDDVWALMKNLALIRAVVRWCLNTVHIDVSKMVGNAPESDAKTRLLDKGRTPLERAIILLINERRWPCVAGRTLVSAQEIVDALTAGEADPANPDPFGLRSGNVTVRNTHVGRALNNIKGVMRLHTEARQRSYKHGMPLWTLPGVDPKPLNALGGVGLWEYWEQRIASTRITITAGRHKG